MKEKMVRWLDGKIVRWLVTMATSLPIYLTIYFFLSISLYPAGTTGGQPMQFLSYGAGARSFGMGKAYVAVANDASATYWNPAGLSLVDRKEFTALYASLFKGLGVSYQFVSFVYPTTSKGTFGLSLVQLSAGGFEKVTIKKDIITGEITELTKGAMFKDSQMAFAASYGRDISRKIGIGATVRYIKRKLDTSSDKAFTMDIGIMAKDVKPGLNFGLNLQHILSFISGDTSDKVPIVIKLGGAYRFLRDKITLALDVTKPTKASFRFNTGFEYWILRYAAFRGGIELGDVGVREMTFGLGSKYKENIFLDMAFTVHHALGFYMMPKASLTWKFGKPVSKKKQDEISKLYNEGVEAYKIGKFMLSLNKFNRAKDINPKDEDVLKIVPKIQTVAAFIPEETSATRESDLLRKAVMFYIEGDINTAIESLRYAYDQQPTNDSLRQLLNKLEESVGLAQTPPAARAIKITPLDFIEKKHTRVQTFFYDGKYDQAINECNEILILDSNNILAMMRMGSAFYALGYKDKALAAWKKALELDPTNKELIDILRSIEERKE